MRLAAALALAWLMLAPPASGGDTVVHYEGARVTLHAEQAPLATVLDRLARETGATLRGDVPDRAVTLDLQGLPVDEVLVRLLGKDNFALTYGADGVLRAIEVLRASEGAPSWPPPSVAEAGSEPRASPDYPQEVMGRTVEVGGRLARELGSQRPTAGQLIHASLRVKSGKLRAEAQQRVLEAFERDPEIEDVFSRTLAAIDDATLARMLRGMGGSRAEEFMTKLAARARSEQLRAKAAAVLEQLRTPAESAG
jgi:hypothetical protein